MAKDTSVLLIPGWISGLLSEFDMVGGVRRIVEYHSEGAIEEFGCAIQGFLGQAFLRSNPRHGAPSLGLDKDFPLLVLVGSYLPTVVVISAQIPLSVPSVFLHGLTHGRDMFIRP